jgi:predicted DNA-binding protein
MSLSKRKIAKYIEKLEHTYFSAERKNNVTGTNRKKKSKQKIRNEYYVFTNT